MDYKQYQKIRILIGLLIGTIVLVATIISNLYLAFAGVLIGVLFLSLVKRRLMEVVVDERVISISGRASQATYVIVTTVLAAIGLFFTFTANMHSNLSLELVGVIFCYIALLLIIIYSLSYYYFNKKYGADE